MLKSVKNFFRKAFVICLFGLTVPLAFAEDEEEAVSFEPAADSQPAPNNPYLFERDKIWILLPLGFLAFISLHLIAYPYLRIKKQKVNLEGKK